MASETNLVHMPASALAQAALGDVLFDRAAFAHLKDLAQTLADSQLIPQHFRGKWQDVLLGCAMAQTMGENPLTLLQGLHVIQGKVGWASQFMIARVNASGKLRGPIRYREEGQGEAMAVTAYATLADTGEEVSFTVSFAMAKAEGWTNRNPKWRNMPQLMLRYRSAAFLIRTHFPEVLLGYHDVEELRDSARHPVEPEYEDPAPSHPSPSRSPSRPRQGDRTAASPPGGGATATKSEATSPLALPAPSPGVRDPLPGSATSTSGALPSGEANEASSLVVPGSTPEQRPTVSSPPSESELGGSGSLQAPAEGGTSSPAPEALTAPDTTLVGAAEASGQGAAAPAMGGPASRITRAKLARQQAEQLRKAESEEERAERQKGHHPSWKEGYKSFARDLAAVQLSEADIDTVSAWCDYRSEQSGKRILRPSHRSPEGRRELLDLLKREAGQAAFLRWADELVDVPQAELAAQKEREAQAAEEGAPIAIEAFPSPEAAIAWGMDKGAFESVEEAREAYNQVRREGQPENAHEMAAMWVAEVTACAAARSRP